MMTTSANSDDTPKMVVEDNVSQATLDRIKAMNEEADMPDSVQMVKSPENASTSPEGPAPINLDADDGAAAKKPTKPVKSEGESTVDSEGDTGSGSADGDDEGGDEGGDDDKSGNTIKLKLHGVEKDYTHHEIKQALGRQVTQAKRLSAMEKSDEMTLGTLLAAAKKGDKGAAKKVQKMLLDGSDKETADDFLDELETVEEDFDENKVLADKHAKELMEAAFADVKESVDFDQHMDKVNTDFKELLPEKVWTTFNGVPESRRALYDLAASGRAETLIGLLNDELSELPLVKQLEIQNDPKLYGDAFTLVVKRDNKRIASEAKQTGQEEDDGLDSVAKNKAAGKESQSSASGPDFDKMTRAEFLAWREKKGLGDS